MSRTRENLAIEGIWRYAMNWQFIKFVQVAKNVRNEVPVVVNQPAVQIQDLTKDYYVGEEVVHALKQVSLQINEGDFVAIMGSSGSGKSTMLHLLGCLDRPTSGVYFLGDEEVTGQDDNRLSEIRATRIGIVFQSFNLIPQLTLLENIESPLYYRGQITREDRLRCEGLAELVGLADRVHHRPSQLSGGQQQRAAIARCLTNDPTVVLADEPTGNLDSTTSEEIMRLLCELNAAGKTIILVTHEDEVAEHCARIIRLRDGIIDSDERT